MMTREQRLEYYRHYWLRNKRRIYKRKRRAGWKERKRFAAMYQTMEPSEAKFLLFLMQQLFAMLATPSILETGTELLLIAMYGNGASTSTIVRKLGQWSMKLTTIGQSDGDGQSTSHTPKGKVPRNMRAARKAMGDVTEHRYTYMWKSKSGRRRKDLAGYTRKPIIRTAMNSIAGVKIYSGRHQRVMLAIEPMFA